jgi:hypothetical protein
MYHVITVFAISIVYNTKTGLADSQESWTAVSGQLHPNFTVQDRAKALAFVTDHCRNLAKTLQEGMPKAEAIALWSTLNILGRLTRLYMSYLQKLALGSSSQRFSLREIH